MGCGGSKNQGAKPAKGRKPAKKKSRKKGKGSAMMVAQGTDQQDRFWDNETLTTAEIGSGYKTVKGDGYMGIAFLERSLDERKGSRYNFRIAKSKHFDFSIGLALISAPERDEDDSEYDSEEEDEEPQIEKVWTVNFNSQKKEVKVWDEDDEELVDDRNGGGSYNLNNWLDEGSVITMAVVDGKVEFAIDDQDLPEAFNDRKINGENVRPVIVFHGEAREEPDSEEEEDSEEESEKERPDADKAQSIDVLPGQIFDPEALAGKKKRKK